MTNIVTPTAFDYTTNIRLIEELICEYPFLSAQVCARTALGRGIFSLSVGNMKNSVIYAGGFHGSEWITSLAILLFTERLCYCIKNKKLLRGVDIGRAFTELGATIIPCVNPDGTEIAVNGIDSAKSLKKFVSTIPCEDYKKWDANALGVDISHNFNADFKIMKSIEQEKGIIGPSYKQYGGEYAESEPETRALTRLCRMRKFRQCMEVHSQGEELYWKYGDKEPKQSSMMAKILADSCSYRLVGNDGFASHGGFKDWFIDEFNKPGFSIEIGKGENPLPVGELYNIYNRIEEAFTIFALM